jgi:hypothetical protein
MRRGTAPISLPNRAAELAHVSECFWRGVRDRLTWQTADELSVSTRPLYSSTRMAQLSAWFQTRSSGVLGVLPHGSTA